MPSYIVTFKDEPIPDEDKMEKHNKIQSAIQQTRKNSQELKEWITANGLSKTVTIPKIEIRTHYGVTDLNVSPFNMIIVEVEDVSAIQLLEKSPNVASVDKQVETI